MQKDLTKLQQREQRIVAKLAEAREAQTRALKRFAEAQARVLLLENHLQAIRASLQPPQSSPTPTQGTSPAPTPTSDAQPVQSAPEPAPHAEANAVQPSTSHEAEHERESIHSPSVAPEPATQHDDQPPEQKHEIIRPLTVMPEATDQPTSGTELLARISAMSAGIPRETLPQTGELATSDLLAEDLEETVRRTIRPPAPQETRMDQAEEDALLAAILALAHEPTDNEDETQKSARQTVQKAEQSLNEVNLAILNGTLSGSEADNALHEAEEQVTQARAQLAASSPAPDAPTSTSESDITDKLPVMHDRDARMREPQ